MTNNIKYLFTSALLLSIMLTACSDPGSAASEEFFNSSACLIKFPGKTLPGDYSTF